MDAVKRKLELVKQKHQQAIDKVSKYETELEMLSNEKRNVIKIINGLKFI